ncbi:MAG: DMT family transporter, partial [Octadecabacter sp.]|nr:DMT family transporter [Octadecabacter sp.]
MALSDNMRAALFMMTSMTAFTVNDTFMKLASPDVPFFQAITLRGMMITVGLLVLAYLRGQLRYRPNRRDWGLISLRTVAEAVGTVFFLTALFRMPIANLSAILQALPLTVTLAAAVFFKEPVGWRRLTAILIGFAGVVMIVQPGTDGFTIYSVFGIGAVVAVTVRDLGSRRLSREIPSGVVALAAAIGVTLMAAIAGAGTAWVKPPAVAMAELVAAAVALVIGYVCAVSAMRTGDIGFVAPFRYMSLLVALVLGWFVFDEWPNALTLAGAMLVVATGLFTLYRERAAAQA